MGRGRSDHRGVAAVVGVVLLFAVVMAGAGAILFMGESTTQTFEERVKVASASDSLGAIDEDAASLGPDRRVRVEMPEWADRTVVEPKHTEVTLTVNGDSRCRTSIQLGAVQYVQETEKRTNTLTLVAGGLIRSSDGQSVVEKPPSIYYDDRQVVLDLNQLRGGGQGDEFTASHKTVASDETQQKKRTALLADDPCAPRQSVNLTVQGPNDAAWYEYLHDEMEKGGTGNVRHEPGADRVVVEFGQNDLDYDSDGDGVLDRNDNCPSVPNPSQRDIDGDGAGDACDDDDDGDGIPDNNDLCEKQVPMSGSTHEDTDGDGLGDACDPDPDGDGYHVRTDVDGDFPHLNQYYNARYQPSDFLGVDNCYNASDPSVDTYNPDQLDTDGNGVGDVCDPDDDGDGIPDTGDSCPKQPETHDPVSPDQDGDGCPDPDNDNDGVDDENDNCPNTYNPNQADTDNDGTGDPCDPTPGGDDDDDGGEDDGDGCTPFDCGDNDDGGDGGDGGDDEDSDNPYCDPLDHRYNPDYCDEDDGGDGDDDDEDIPCGLRPECSGGAPGCGEPGGCDDDDLPGGGGGRKCPPSNSPCDEPVTLGDVSVGATPGSATGVSGFAGGTTGGTTTAGSVTPCDPSQTPDWRPGLPMDPTNVADDGCYPTRPPGWSTASPPETYSSAVQLEITVVEFED